ncbi:MULTISPECIES: Holliday junction resolvase RuvX [Janthinobacterium]|jgi:putative holliday junction resolvase|uniref:Putative pre-16S rRNA nuclease n=1 Tax=Janthinobacterium rivuli TaxID=2751478 RepID=A0ABY8I2J5_9BURK|nr:MULTISPECIES: Holliday junction resolvase RuvX [Janthinobacterium]MCA1861526.1 Holliday junction resolvase RuvX [Janthinobacterium lividum]PJJ19708.1 putative Holliday junction resolvase [Janthinobacterium sp. 67]WFR79110.1 Holliday junction resolvase RuvX [Janthinobacterium rivuli]SDM10722.1 putative holliday junction resolvase [Janthinobacterium sp. OK676]
MSGDAIDTILAFDFGLKRIGVAIGNTMICQAKPLSVITATANEPKFAAIDSLIKEWGASRIVVGLPSHPDGTEHEMSARCRRFANQVHGRFNLPVELVDERYSSAVIAARRGEVIDDRAAAIILQQYFDANY